MILLLLALAPEVSYYRDIAPVLTFQCNRCHGDEGAAGGLDTRTYGTFKNVNPSLLLDLLEGQRGASRLMPRDARPLDAATIAKFRQWIAEGAREDRDTTPRRTWSAALPVRGANVACDTKSRAYVSVQVLDTRGQELYHTADVVEGKRSWTVRRASHWPNSAQLLVTVSYGPEGATVSFAEAN